MSSRDWARMLNLGVLGPSSPWGWLAVLLTGGVLIWCYGRPWLMGGVVAWVQLRTWFDPTNRIVRQFNRGDRAGACLALRAWLDRQTATPTPLAGVTADPWQAPTAPSAAAAEKLANGWHNLAIMEAERGDWSAALTAYERAEQVDPTPSPLLQGNKAGALLQLGRRDEGIALLRAALAEDADEPWMSAAFRATLAEALLDAGEVAEVGAILDRAERDGRQTRTFSESGWRAWQARLDALRARLDQPPVLAPTEEPTR